MTSEQELNSLIKNSLPFGFKIPDPAGLSALSATPRVFDGFGIILQEGVSYPVYWESKFSKKLQAFNLSKIEDHQADNLSLIASLLPSAKVWVIYGVQAGRADARVYIFDWRILKSRYEEKRNILKKELVPLPYNKVVKKEVQLINIISKEIQNGS